MKAVIVEIDSKYAIALDKNGDFIKINNDGRLKVGYEVDVPSAKVFNMKLFIKTASIAASFLLFIGISYGAYSYSRPYSYVDIDINPSIEFTTNIYDRIIKAEGLNDDGKKLLEKNDFKNKSLNDGVEGVIKNAASEGFIKNDVQNAVMITVSSKDEAKADKIEEEAKNAANKKIKDEKVESDVLIEKVNIQRHDEALQQGISPGKLLLIERLRETNPEVKVEDAKKLPVRDILKQINKNKKEIKIDERQNSTSNKSDNKSEKQVPPGQIKEKDRIKGIQEKIEEKTKDKSEEIRKDFESIRDKKSDAENNLTDKLEKTTNDSKSKIEEILKKFKDKTKESSYKKKVPSNKGSSVNETNSYKKDNSQ